MANSDTNTFLNPNAIQDQAITSDKIADGAINSDKIEDFSITEDKIYNGNVTTDKIANNAVTTAKIADDNVTTEKIADSAVTTDKIEGEAVTSDELADNAVITKRIKDSAVTTAKIADSNVTTTKLSNSAVTTEKINNNAVTNEKLASSSVTTAKIADDAITTAKIAGEAVTSDELADSAVINSKIHDNAITTAKIVDNAITTVKIHNLDVTNDKIANKTITGSKIKNQTIWSNKLTWQTLSDASSDVDSSGILYTPVGPVETAAMFDNNVLSLGRPDGLLVEYSRNYVEVINPNEDTTKWYEYYLSNYDKKYNDIKKVNVMTNGDPSSFSYFAGGRNYKVTDSDNGTLYSSDTDIDTNRKMGTSSDALRFTFDAKDLGVYAQVVQIYAFISTNGNNITLSNGSKVGRLKVKLETSLVSAPDTFTTVANNITVTGWSGWNAIPFNGARFGHPNYDNISNSTYVRKIRLTFTSEGASSEGNNWFQVIQFKFLATDAWGFPSELAKNKHLYKTEIDSIVDSKDAKGNDIRVPRPNMILTGNIKPNDTKVYDNGTNTNQWKNLYSETIFENGKQLSDKYIPYINNGGNTILKSGLGYGFTSESSKNNGMFISGIDVIGGNTYGGQLSGSFDGTKLAFRGLNAGSFTDWKDLAFNDDVTNIQTTLTGQINSLQTSLEGQINTQVSAVDTRVTNLTNNINGQITTLTSQINSVDTRVSSVESNFNTQITNLTNSTQKAVYDYDSTNPNNISDITTSPTLLAKSNGLGLLNDNLAFFDTKFDGNQSVLSPRVQVAYGHDSDVIGFRRYKFDNSLNKWNWTDWNKVSFEGHTHTSNETLNIHLKTNATGDGFEIVDSNTRVNILKYASVIYDESSYEYIYLPIPKQQTVGAKITLIINNGQKGSNGINIRTGKYMSGGHETVGGFLIPNSSSNGNTIVYTESNIITLDSYTGTYLTTISFISNGNKWIVYYEK